MKIGNKNFYPVNDPMPPEEWKRMDVGEARYGWYYEISNMGRVRRVEREKYTYMRISNMRKGNNRYFRFYVKKKPYILAREVYRYFVGEIPDGMYVVHKNGMISDNCFMNLVLISRKTCGERYGRRNGRVRSIVRVDAKGNIVEIYKNAQEASEKCGKLCRSSIINRCNGKVLDRYMPDGSTFMWEE